MLCQTIKQGTECLFMTEKGCSYNGGTCYPIVESCHGCNRTVTTPHGIYCRSCPDPAAKWRNGTCNLATHIDSKTEQAVKLNPLKASKRSRKKAK
ncbi:MAG: PxxKW family cysteine-rich protein [Syntrophobacteria bacterium]